MRDNTFRAFYKGRFFYFTIGQLWGEYMLQIYYELVINGVKFEQFTGLYDKNRKEIYEGDIIENFDSIRVVEQCNGGWDPFIADMETDDSWHWQVIGNINENKELLE